jgi:hypothetical protein
MIRREFDRLLPRVDDAASYERTHSVVPAEGRPLRSTGYARLLQPV